jgi:hypothetical protein
MWVAGTAGNNVNNAFLGKNITNKALTTAMLLLTSSTGFEM